VGRVFSTKTVATRPKQLPPPIFAQIPRAYEYGSYANMRVVVLLQYTLVQSYGVSNFPHQTAQNLRLTVSVFLCTFEVTALLLKKIHLHLHSDTLTIAIGFYLHFLQLIARNGHKSRHVHLLSISHHLSVYHAHTSHVRNVCTCSLYTPSFMIHMYAICAKCWEH